MLCQTLDLAALHPAYLPSGQIWQDVLPLAGLYFPAGHMTQERVAGVLVEAAAVLNLPPGQLEQTHFPLLRYLPAGQGPAHSIVATLDQVPTVFRRPGLMSMPAGQLVQAEAEYVHEYWLA